MLSKLIKSRTPQKKSPPPPTPNRDQLSHEELDQGFLSLFKWCCYENSGLEKKFVPQGSPSDRHPP